jgi:ethanolamine utilization protein EutQ
MTRRVITAAHVRDLADEHRDRLLLDPADIVTPLARDEARRLGIAIEPAADRPADTEPEPASERRGESPAARPRVLSFPTRDLTLPTFTASGAPPAMDVRLLDIVTATHGSPMAAGLMSLREGSFAWTLDYDEIDYVLEGELHIESAEGTVVGLPGEIVFIPKGSRIKFTTPSWTKFLYVTFPAEWGGA